MYPSQSWLWFYLLRKFLGRLIIGCSIIYSVMIKFLGTINCAHHSSKTQTFYSKQFISEVCMLGPDGNELVEHREFILNSTESKAKNYSYYCYTHFILFLTGLISTITIEWFEQCNNRKLSQIKYLERSFSSLNFAYSKSNKKLYKFFNRFVNDSQENQNCLNQFILILIISTLISILQFSMLIFIFGTNYATIGFQLISFVLRLDSLDPISEIFPVVIVCRLKIYGPSGSLSTIDNICTLNHNLINAYIFIALWFFFLLIVLSIINASCRLISNIVFKPKSIQSISFESVFGLKKFQIALILINQFTEIQPSQTLELIRRCDQSSTIDRSSRQFFLETKILC
ncbi:putative peptide chain release factor [Sarcoptes scabiei]|nr:putative peptide chain release factor [Sarcoptes scabiei]